MDAEFRKDFAELKQQVNGVCAAVETGFREVKKDISYLGRAYLPLIAVSLIALVLSLCSLVIALENRSLILGVSAQTSANTRDLEHLLPLIDLDKGK